jgi:hypothetical protein
MPAQYGKPGVSLSRHDNKTLVCSECGRRRHVDPDRREWRCDCADFARRAERYREGFCAHVAVAIEQALRDGQIDFSGLASPIE